jgi:hypothetical protein
MVDQVSALPLRCPCCLYKTLGERGGYEICDVCGWEDDGQDDVDADQSGGPIAKDFGVRGPNGALTLTQARANFKSYGARDESARTYVRPPRPDET